MKKKIIKAVLGVMAAKNLLQNSQGARDENNVNVMRGTGIAVRGTKFQGVF